MKSKLILTLIMSVGLFVAGYAQFVWQEDGIPVRQGRDIEYSRIAVPIGDSEVLLLWTDTRNGYRELWASALDETGHLWNNGEILIKGGVSKTQQTPAAVQTSDGNVLISWIEYDFSDESGIVYAQKITTEGELLWGEGVIVGRGNPYRSVTRDEKGVNTGTRCETRNYNHTHIRIVPDDNGGAFIFWEDTRSQRRFDIYGMYLNSNGEPHSENWTADGLLLSNPDKNSVKISSFADGWGGVIIVFEEYANNYGEIIGKRISSYGEVWWERVLRGDETMQKGYINPDAAALGNDRFAVTYVSVTNSNYSVYVNLIHIDGDSVWDEDVLVASDTGYSSPRIVSSGEESFIVAWRSNDDSRNIVAQMFDLEGDRIWNEGGITMGDDQSHQYDFSMIGSETGGAVISWINRNRDESSDTAIYIQEITADGDLVWHENGRTVSDMTCRAFAPYVTISGDKLYTFWLDKRDDYTGLYYQVYDNQGQQMLTDNGAQITWGLCGEVASWYYFTVRNGDYMYVVWADDIRSQIMVQKIDREGNLLFAENGIPIAVNKDYYGTYDQGQAIAGVPHHQGGIALVWVNDSSIFAQAIGPNGEFLWDDSGNGLLVCSSSRVYAPLISKDGEDYLIAWNDYLSARASNIMAQKIVDGNKVWADEGVLIAGQPDGFESYNHIRQIAAGKHFVWSGDTHRGNTVFVKKIDDQGQAYPGWNEHGNPLVVREDGKRVRFVNNAFLTEQGLVVFWIDTLRESSFRSFYSLKGQLINESGETQWDNVGWPMGSLNDYQTGNFALQYDDGYIYIVWNNYTDNSTPSNLKYQKIDLEGNLLWGDPSPDLTASETGDSYPGLVKIGDKVLIVWNSRSSWSFLSSHLQLVNARTGEKQWSEEGVMLNQTSGWSRVQIIAHPDEGYAFALWRDSRSDRDGWAPSLYAQKIDTTFGLDVDGDTVLPVIEMTLYANYPNPFNPETNISFSLPQNEMVSLNIYNIRGHLVKSLVTAEYLEKGTHNLLWNGTDKTGKRVGSGVYLYKLENERQQLIRKMILLK